MMETRKLKSLRPHPTNEAIYGAEQPEPLFVESIRTLGLLHPLLISHDDRVISGHRRWKGAEAAGLKDAPVVVFASTDELDILEALIHANKQREKSNEVIGREAAALLDIERERAKARQATSTGGADPQLVMNSSQAENPRGAQTSSLQLPVNSPEAGETQGKGDSRDRVGKILGVSGKTVERATAVVKKIDELESDGKEEEAEALRNTLNNKSVSAAFKAATAPHTNGHAAPIRCNDCIRKDCRNNRDCKGCERAREEAKNKPPPAPEPPSVEEEMKEANSTIESFCRSLMEFVKQELPTDPWLDDDNAREGALRKFEDGCSMLRRKKCAALCPVCKGKKTDGGKKCRPCHGTGRVTKFKLDQMV